MAIADLISSQQIHNFFQAPNVIGNARCHFYRQDDKVKRFEMGRRGRRPYQKNQPRRNTSAVARSASVVALCAMTDKMADKRTQRFFNAKYTEYAKRINAETQRRTAHPSSR
jgi:hypothetical protein